MVSQLAKNECSGCGACQFVCPQNCIRMERDEEGFLYPKIDKKSCSGCFLCEKYCPSMNHDYNNRACYSIAAFNTDEEVRKNSSSGGIFWLLANSVIEKDGVVYGVICDSDKSVHHIRATSMEEVRPMMGSKYVQSNTGKTYFEALEDLKREKKVLFSGTPCQIAGLLKVLKKEKIDTVNLITVDIVCHGVPSPAVWEYYCDTKLLEADETIEKVNFRDKRTGWKCFSLSVQTNQKFYHQDIQKDQYMVAFLKNFSLRPSCYSCRFKGINRRASDVTLADFWGVGQELLDYFDDDKGVSWVTANSDKGRKFLQSFEHTIWHQEVEAECGIRHNFSAIRPTAMPKARAKFFRGIAEKKNFDKLTLQCAGETGIIGLLKKIKRKMKK